jgi:hypothetical protein
MTDEIKAAMERHMFLKRHGCTNPRDHDWILAEAFIAMYDDTPITAGVINNNDPFDLNRAKLNAIIAKLVEALDASNVELQNIFDCGFDHRDDNKADDYGVLETIISANNAAIKAAEGK